MFASGYRDFNSSYKDILKTILHRGISVPSRAGNTIEIENASLEFQNPRLCIQSKRPGFSPLLGFMEGAQLVGSFARPTLMDTVWPNYSKYSDHWGDYGDRMAVVQQLNRLFVGLQNDPGSRRHVVTMWDPRKDIAGDHKDHPCTIGIGFRVRDDALNMTVNMRSNDVWFGLSSDVIQFSLLQTTFATALGLRVGTYLHHAHSLHLYTDHVEAVQAYLRDEQETQYPVSLLPLSDEGWSYGQIQAEAINTLLVRGDCATPMGKQIQSMLDERKRAVL